MNRVESESHQIAKPANSCIRSRARHKIILRMCRAYKIHIVRYNDTVNEKPKDGVRANSCYCYLFKSPFVVIYLFHLTPTFALQYSWIMIISF